MSASDKPSKAERILRHFHLWSRRAATLVLILLVVVIGAGVYLWTSQSDLLAARAAAFLNARLFGPGTHVVVGKIRGMPFQRLILEDVRLEGEGPEGKLAFLSARELEVEYDLWGILHGRYVASNAAARGLHVEFLQGERGLALPTFRTGKKKSSSRATTFRIENIAVADGTARVELPWRTVTIDSLNGGLTVESGSEGLKLTANRLRGRMNDALGTIELDRGTLSVRAPIRFQALEGRWSGSPFAISGTITKNTDLEVQIQDFPLGRLGKFLDRTDLDRGYVTRIQGNLKNENGRVTFDAAGDMSWQEWVLENVSGRGAIENGMLELRDLNLRLEGATLSRGFVRIPLHEAWFSVNVEAENLNTASLRIPVLDKAPGIVNGSGELRFGDRKNFLRSLDMNIRLSGGEILEVPFTKGNVNAVVRDGTFRFDSLFVALDGARAAARGKAGENFLDLQIDYAGDLVPLRRLAKQPTLGGLAELQAHLNGPPRSPMLIGQGEVRQFEVSTIRAPRLVVEEARGPVNVDQNLRVRARAPQGLRVSNLTFAHGFVTLTAARDSARVDSVAVANRPVDPDTLVYGRGSVRWGREIRVSVNEATVLAGAHTYEARSPFTIWRRGDLVSTPGIVIDTPRGNAAVEGNWNVSERNGRLRADLRDVDPSIFFALPPPLAIGKISGIIELHGTGDHLAGRADVGLREIDWKEGRAHFDSARVVALLEDRELRVEPLLARRGAGEVEIRGRIGLPEPLVPIVKKLRERRYPDPGNTRWDLEVTGRGIDLADWKFLVPPGQPVSGGLEVSGHLSGTSERPEIEMSGAARRLNWKGLEVDSLGAKAAYRGGSVHIAELVLAQGPQSGTLRGTLPVDLVLLPFSFKVPERPMDLRVEASDGSLHALGFTPWIKKASGSLQADLRLAGTPRYPLLDGWARVQNGRVELRERDEVVQNITARFSMKRDVVEVEEAKGILTVAWAGTKLHGGTVSVEPGGTYRLATRQEQSYRLRIRLNQGLVGERGIYAAQVSGNVELTPQRASDGRIYPTARGNLFVHRLEYGGSLKPQDVGDLKPPSLLYEVNIDAPNKILINADRAEGELGGELTVRRTPERQEIVGTLDVIEGKYQFLQKTFRVTQGTLTWDTPDSRIPRVNIDAETKEGGAGGGYLITVNLSGYANQVQVRFFAESLEGGAGQRGLSESEIMSLLAFGSLVDPRAPSGTIDIGGSEAGQSVGVVGIDALLGGTVERELANQIGINADIEIENAYSPYGEEPGYVPTVGVGTYFGDVRLQYRQGLSRTYEQNIGLEYRLRRAFIVRGSIINLPSEANQEYNLELKLHHDY